MPVFYLTDKILFPPVHYAEPSGILAVGGDLAPERLLEAYSHGIFPWFSDDSPIVWWSPDPRFVVYPSEIKVSRSMRQVLERGVFRITFDRAFRDVITACSLPRKHEQGTWITDDMIEAYVKLHEIGYAHSIEAWKGESLAGGLYGVSLGRTFFGESMFSRESNASKAAFITLAVNLRRNGFDIIDCQVHTEHLESLGAFEMPRDMFIGIIRKSLAGETIKGNWGGSSLFDPVLASEELRSQGC